jgi:hypothetical protein
VKNLQEIQQQLLTGNFEFTRHAFKRSIERNISKKEIQQTGLNVILIENYPDDKYSPSFLLLGFTETHRPLHLQVSLIDSDKLKIITLYEPDSNQWINYQIRR